MSVIFAVSLDFPPEGGRRQTSLPDNFGRMAGLTMFSELTLLPSLPCTFAGALVPTFAAFGAVEMTVEEAGLFEVVLGGVLMRVRGLSDGADGFRDDEGIGVL